MVVPVLLLLLSTVPMPLVLPFAWQLLATMPLSPSRVVKMLQARCDDRLDHRDVVIDEMAVAATAALATTVGA